ncbi:MAG: hypothetical protein ABR951_05785 [Candidatus Aminicenantales bacterium]|jgi:hypothetical protein
MKNKLLPYVLSFGLLMSGAAPLRGGITATYGGYFALEFLKGQSQSGYAQGSIQNIQAGLMASGAVSSKFQFTLEVRSRTESLFEIEQAWVGFVPSQVISVKAGMYLVPFGIWNRASRPYETLLIGTPLNLEYLYPASWRDLGVLVEGKIGILDYSAYIGNGLKEADSLQDGQQFSDNNKDKGKGGRLGLQFNNGLEAAISYYTGKYDDLDERSLTLEGADFSWVADQWEVKAEVTRALIDNPEPFANGKSEGYSVWMVMKFATFQPVGSFQKVKVDDPYHGGGTLIDRSRWTLGCRVVLGPKLFLKAEYEWNQETPNIKDNLFRVQAALGF